ncbi:MAG: PEP-CTERM sorting domain-containing protein [Pirellulaceae bacterium]|nr:PEP-CTERM sorting domain-containing protein [Pirellulaceae bacterium]
MQRAFALLGTIVLLMGLATFSQAETIYISQDFEDAEFTVGYEFTSMSDGLGDASITEGLWRRGYGTHGAYPAVSDISARSGSKSILLDREYDNTQTYRFWGYTEVPEGDGITSGQFVASAYFNRNGTGGTCAAFRPDYPGNVTDSSWETIETGYVSFSDGELKARTWKGVNAWSDPILTVPETGWFGVAMVVDLDTNYYDVWYDDGSGWTEVSSDIEMNNPSPPLAINSIQFLPQAPADGYVLVDDIMLYSGSTVIPEPSTLALLACGLLGLLAYAWRKRR